MPRTTFKLMELFCYIFCQLSGLVETMSTEILVQIQNFGSFKIFPRDKLFCFFLSTLLDQQNHAQDKLNRWKIRRNLPVSTNIFMLMRSRTRGSWSTRIPSKMKTSEGLIYTRTKQAALRMFELKLLRDENWK